MKVLVTGHEGYIGTQLVPILKERGHEVHGLDTRFYTDGLLYEDGSDRTIESTQKDIREVTLDDVAGFDAVVHLAELSNDPLSMHDEDNTYAINHRGSVKLARLCKEAGVERFVYSSSCSVYGIQNGDDIKTEASEPLPQTAYARCKVLVERDVSQLADEDFTPTFLRNATAYGPSPRMRFDIVLNNLSGLAWTTGEVRMISDGTPWRPLVHVKDIGKAMRCVLEAPRDVVHNEVFNVGNTEENYQIREIAEVVSETFPDCTLTVGAESADNRSYRVAFDKIHEQLPGFSCDNDVPAGAEQLLEVFEEVDLSPETFEYRPFTRLKQLKHLLETEQIDERFFWNHKS